jgi:predicted nucleotidyltransferase
VAVLEEAMADRRGLIAPDALGQAILAHYRLADPDALAACASMRGGLAHRLCEAAHAACSLEEMLALAATKVYTNTRIRRAVLHGMLGVTEADLCASPSATLVLAANGTGRAMLREVRQMGGMPLIPKPADLAAVVSERETLLRRRAEALWTLALPCPMAGGAMVRERPYLDEA